MTTTDATREGLRLSVAALVVGVIDALVFVAFEWVVKDGTDWLWNDFAGSDSERWRVIPLALVLSIAFSALLRALKQPRYTPPHLDPLHSADRPAGETPPPPTLSGLGVILLVGIASLVAGASLGPEASLVALTMGLGLWVGARTGSHGQVIALASVGALLVAFLGSLVAILIPLLVLQQRVHKLPLGAVVPVLIAGFAAWGTLELLPGEHAGFGDIPSMDVRARDYVGAVLLGAIAVGVGVALRWLVSRLSTLAERIERSTPWWVAAAVFGAVLGLLYLLGGPTVEFSGSEGSADLLSGDRHYGGWALAGLVLVKLVATAWSLSAGYRGGLVFPSIYAAVAVSLLAGVTLSDLAGPGILLGSVAGLLVEMTAPALGVVMLLALLPADLVLLGLAGGAGAVAGRALVTRLGRSD